LHANSGDITREHGSRRFVVKSDVVRSMTRSVQHSKILPTNGQHLPVSNGHDLPRRSWDHLSPQRIHLISVDPRRAAQQFRGVDEVWRAYLVHIYAGIWSTAKELTYGSRMIQMDMRDNDGRKPLNPIAKRRQCLKQVRQRGRRSRLDEAHFAAIVE
jgi:hypothetical protein